MAIIGEGETEWFYLDSLRIAKHYPFKMKPTYPKHSDWRSIFKQAHQCLSERYDLVICLVDMDVVYNKPTEKTAYLKAKAKAEKAKIKVIETNPCTEFWFLLHFLPKLSSKTYTSYEEVVVDLRRYLPNYEKSKKYFKKIPLYQYLSAHGDLSRAVSYASQLLQLAQETPEDLHSYTQIHEMLEFLECLSK